MLPVFLVEDSVRAGDGTSDAIELGAAKGKALMLTLGITSVIEQESIDISVWGSADGTEWGAKPLAKYPQKSYCGTHSLLVDLSGSPDTSHIRLQWKCNRWGRGETKPQFGFYVFAEEAGVAA